MSPLTCFGVGGGWGERVPGWLGGLLVGSVTRWAGGRMRGLVARVCGLVYRMVDGRVGALTKEGAQADVDRPVASSLTFGVGDFVIRKSWGGCASGRSYGPHSAPVAW